MDMGLIRGLITVSLLVLFIGLWFWIWSSKRGEEYSAASRVPLEEDEHPLAHSNEMEQHS